MTPAEFRTIREQAGLSQSGLAERLGLARETVNLLENGRRAIKPIHEYALRWIAAHSVALDDSHQ